MLKFVRYSSNSVSRKKVSIIGSGPSGFYTAYHLLNKSQEPLHVTIWEKLPIPFGLSRFGVAPDHPEVKNCEDTFTKCAEEQLSNHSKHKFEFIGGVEIGDEIKLKQLLNKQDAVVLSYGCSGDRKLGILGEEDTSGVFSSREFVNWYNGHPNFALQPKFTKFDWSKVRKVGIIGNGNVALDIARVFISNRVDDIWKSTDISPIALECLKKAPIENVKIIGRRDFLHSKFTNKELRELWELEKYGIHGQISNDYFRADIFDSSKLDRAFNRRVEMCSEYLKPFEERTKKNYRKVKPLELTPDGIYKKWELDYLKSPLKINKDDTGHLKSLVLSQNVVTEDNKIIKDEAKNNVEYQMDVLITSLGYAGKPMSEFSQLGIKFERDHLSNKEGRVLNVQNQIYPKMYTSGWIQKGSQGVIASTMMNAFDVADKVLADLSFLKETSSSKGIDVSLIKHTTWKDWEILNRKELELGKLVNKKRLKYLTTEEMYKNVTEED